MYTIRHTNFEKMKYLITYGDNDYIKSRERLKKEAESLNIFDKVIAYGSEDLPEEFKKKTIFKHKRGSGLWVWKPYLIRKTLEQMNDGDILVYVDSGCNLYKSTQWNRYFSILSTRYDMLAFKIACKCGAYTKKSVLEYFNQIIGPYWKNFFQIAGGILFIKKSPHSTFFLKEWENLCTENNLCDVTQEEKAIQLPEFIEHRHDQSILSGLIYAFTKRIKILPQDFEGRRFGQAICASRCNDKEQKRTMPSRGWGKHHITRPIRLIIEHIEYLYWEFKNQYYQKSHP